MLIDLSHPRWNLFFPDVCSIEASGEGTVNDLGEIVSSTGPLEGHDALQCQVVFKSGKVSSSGEVIEVESIEIGLRGFFPQVKSGMKVTVAATPKKPATRYKILSAGSDSQHVKTRLLVEVTA